MIVPDYWAEARKQHRGKDRQLTVRRFGWSSSSATEAQAVAERRADEALRQILAGDKTLAQRESKTAYNGATGVPIREEVLARHGEEVITRNSYGARCLNTPSALFADIDFSIAPRARHTLGVFALFTATSVLVGAIFHSWALGFGLWMLSLFLIRGSAALFHRLALRAQGGHEDMAHRRIHGFLARNPAWGLRVYRTPGGLRLLATHALFEASSPEVAEFFSAVGADPLYVRMCQNQQCFRARLSAKPWRIGIGAHMRPRPGVWPVHPDRMPVRSQWIAAYEQAAAAFAACHFLNSVGSERVHPELGRVIELHDREARANELALPLA